MKKLSATERKRRDAEYKEFRAELEWLAQRMTLKEFKAMLMKMAVAMAAEGEPEIATQLTLIAGMPSVS